MGLLDDAIREHLDLKRRRGADPTEIERAEREALGPVRRGPEAAEDVAPDAVLEADEEHLDSEEHLIPTEAAAEPDRWDRFEEDPELQELEDHDESGPYDHAHTPGGDPLLEDEPFPEPGVQPPSHPADQSEPLEAEPPSVPPRAPAAPHLDQETEEYELEDEPEADDVLESTPEFLQDAPDHDRLWFEQRPPRDFDFDG